MEEPIKQKKWFSRNWKWVVPSVGCLSIIVVFILLFTTMVSKVTGMFKDSVPYTVGMENLLKNEFVIKKLGEPIETDGMFQGNINYVNDQGTADLKIPIKGPKGDATLLIIAEKNESVWIYQTMKVSFKGDDEMINLLPILEGKE